MNFVMYLDQDRLPLIIDVAKIRHAGDVVEAGARLGHVSGQLIAENGRELPVPRGIEVPFESIKRIECSSF